ncbi:hypothetical protein, partial [Candidatus Albibeggiatoa sp. nov. BB20]|uniref:N-acyl amino acid synthase FeeM domain-containing protein n=1 Tax=Candidatus Albibeggiatoa sp. nov. BB20 TaxID=3162723 RepID=UPI003365AFA8
MKSNSPQDDNMCTQQTKLQLEVGLAKTQQDIEDSFKLVYQQYRKIGASLKNDSCMHITLWSLLPQSFIIIARRQQKIVGTITCVIDSKLGLLMDEIAKPQLDTLRQKGRRLCEISADASIDQSAGNPTILEMYRFGYKLAKEFLGTTDFVVAVGQRHEKFFKRILFFEQIAEIQAYKKAQYISSVPLRLDLCKIESLYQKKYAHRAQWKNLYYYFCQDQKDAFNQNIKYELSIYQKVRT